MIVDAVGVTEADLHDTVPIERNPNCRFDRLLQRLAYGARDRDSSPLSLTHRAP